VHIQRTGIPPSSRPRQLPPSPTVFTGREAELEQLDALIADAAGEQPSRPVVVVTGAAGVGKTSLAVHWAHRAQDRFPDGQLHINLRGHHTGPSLTAEQALSSVLRSLGLPGERIPPDVDGMAGAFRSVVAGRRMIVVLDDAAGAEQVRPLLPGSAGCVVLVTSRSRLSGLAARDGARRITLQTLSPAAAESLLREIVGHDRADREPDSIAELSGHCGRLPLALRIAAERVATRPHSSVRDFVGELAAEHRRLDALAADDDEETAVRTVFDASYRALTRDAARLFRLLGLHPGPDIGLPAAAALADAAPEVTRRHLDALIAVHLITEVDRDRFQFHDLLRVYAAECARVDEVRAERDVATRRLFEWYVCTASAGLSVCHPQHLRPPELPPVGQVPAVRPLAFTGADEATWWFTTEHANLMALVRHAHEVEDHTAGWQLPNAIDSFLADHRHQADRRAAHRFGLAAAHRLGHLPAELWSCQRIGDAYSTSQMHQEAMVYFRRAMKVARKLDQQLGNDRTSGEADLTWWEQWAIGMRATGNPARAGGALIVLARGLHRRGRLDCAMIRLRQALEIAGRLESVPLRCDAMDVFRDIYTTLSERGRTSEAEEVFCELTAVMAAVASALES
jgi:tetratricopeptide (TPR) repeat protein